jgi:quercetin dioxygenase-like cupin family protein
MAELFAKCDPMTLQANERKGGGASSRDLAGALGCENYAARVWTFGPGHEMEELYQLISGGPQQVQIGDELVDVQDGEWLRLPKDTPRRIVNHTDREATWLALGAPRGTGITDGIRLDPETGQEIPRT